VNPAAGARGHELEDVPKRTKPENLERQGTQTKLEGKDTENMLAILLDLFSVIWGT